MEETDINKITTQKGVKLTAARATKEGDRVRAREQFGTEEGRDDDVPRSQSEAALRPAEVAEVPRLGAGVGRSPGNRTSAATRLLFQEGRLNTQHP